MRRSRKRVDEDFFDLLPTIRSVEFEREFYNARKWYFESIPRLFNVLSPATFLSNLGQVLIAQYLIHENKSAEFKNLLDERSDYEKVEQMACGISSVKLTAEIFEHWSMEERLVNALRYCDNPMNAPSRDRLYAQILHCIHTVIPPNGIINEESIKEAATLVEEYDLDLQKFMLAVEQAS